jgi:hypothetical protein
MTAVGMLVLPEVTECAAARLRKRSIAGLLKMSFYGRTLGIWTVPAR